MKQSAIALLFLLTLPAVSSLAETPLERGTYLMRGIVACGNCHTAPGGPMAKHELAGGFNMKEGPIDAMTPNLTPHRDTGIGNWTDAQLMIAIRDGKRPDGSLIGPPMADLRSANTIAMRSLELNRHRPATALILT